MMNVAMAGPPLGLPLERSGVTVAGPTVADLKQTGSSHWWDPRLTTFHRRASPPLPPRDDVESKVVSRLRLIDAGQLRKSARALLIPPSGM